MTSCTMAVERSLGVRTFEDDEAVCKICDVGGGSFRAMGSSRFLGGELLPNWRGNASFMLAVLLFGSGCLANAGMGDGVSEGLVCALVDEEGAAGAGAATCVSLGSPFAAATLEMDSSAGSAVARVTAAALAVALAVDCSAAAAGGSAAGA